MLYNLSCTFLIFIFYSFVGYLIETIFVSIVKKKINFSRGFLIGPILPIYGVAALLMHFTLHKYKDDIIVLFLLATILSGIVEYLTSYLMEKMFKTRWWDYSTKLFNLNGRICLQNLLGFGFFGIIFIKYIDFNVVKILLTIPSSTIFIITSIIFILFIIDNVFSFNVIFKLTRNVKHIAKIDSTAKIKSQIKKYIVKNKLLVDRLIKAFPNMIFTYQNNLVSFIKENLKK